uniref:Gonadotropin subunit beta-2 n=1 Tax=Neogobius melanostomus TaxID=47308 RepID=A0A8C6V0C5_9GOBI
FSHVSAQLRPVGDGLSLSLVSCRSDSASTLWLMPFLGFHLPRCQLVNQTVSLEKEGCPRCHTVETTICSGHCPTKDPVLKIPFSHVYQDVCTYRDFFYREVELPVALSCHCGRCSMDTSDCTFESLQPNFCMNDIPFYY